jgi:hypothetical protein
LILARAPSRWCAALTVWAWDVSGRVLLVAVALNRLDHLLLARIDDGLHFEDRNRQPSAPSSRAVVRPDI